MAQSCLLGCTCRLHPSLLPEAVVEGPDGVDIEVSVSYAAGSGTKAPGRQSHHILINAIAQERNGEGKSARIRIRVIQSTIWECGLRTKKTIERLAGHHIVHGQPEPWEDGSSWHSRPCVTLTPSHHSAGHLLSIDHQKWKPKPPDRIAKTTIPRKNAAYTYAHVGSDLSSSFTSFMCICCIALHLLASNVRFSG